MIDQLRIQCPSCGIILDVKNSKHEAVKRITCPKCQRQLAVDFQDKVPQTLPKSLGSLYYGEMRIDLQEGVNQIPLPACSALEIRVVKLKDGNSKCIVRVQNEEKPISLNGETLGKEDEVALALGDELKIGDAVLSYGQPAKAFKAEEKPVKESMNVPPNPKAQVHIPQWSLAVAALAVALVAVWLLWPSKQEGTVSPIVKTTVDDSIIKDTTKKEAVPSAPSSENKKKNITENVTVNQAPTEPTSEYNLEKMALNGDVRAQYELGNKLVRRSGISNIIRGVKYLRLATNNGSSEAKNTLVRVINTLQRQADNGDSIAYQVLLSIDHQ